MADDATDGGGTPYPDDPLASTAEHLRCAVCGDTFVVYDDADRGSTLPSTAAFLRRHRRCLQRTLTIGGAIATPAPQWGHRTR